MSVAVHLERLDAALVGPRRAKRGLLREAGDHLEDATDAYLAAGYERREAETLAVRDFGTVDELAPAFQTTLAVASSRRTAASLLAVLGVQPFIWDGGIAQLLHLDSAAPSGWAYRVLDTTIEYGGGLVILLAVLLVAATGIGNRWRPAGRRVARVTGRFAIGAVVFLPVTGVAMTMLTEPANLLAWAHLVVLLLVPMALVGLSARRTLATA